MDINKNEKKIPNIAIINGPNINILGVREPDIYGKESWNIIETRLNKLAIGINVKLLFFQSNHEAFIVNFIQENLNLIDAVVINPAAYTKNGYSVLDALTSINIPFVEVHLSNIFARGGWHAESIFADKAIGQIIGFRGFVYDLGIMALSDFITKDLKKIEGGRAYE